MSVTTTTAIKTMSNYHLMRNFTALLRMLGYPRFISLENFRRPNFFLTADILVYLLKRFDSELELDAKIDTEQERLAFVRTASQLMVSKAHLDINTKNLYMADVNAVHEIIKLARLIHDAWLAIKDRKEFETKLEDGGGGVSDGGNNDIMENNQLDRTVYNNFKTNSLTSEILQMGTQLYDILGTEDANKVQRQTILGKQLVVEQIESSIRQSIQMLQEEIVTLQEQQENLDQDNEDLDAKIEKKYAELNRNKKRQQTLYSQRPVFVDELEKVEQEIVQLYDTYVVNCRCLFFLEQKLEEFEEAEKLKIDERNEDIKQMLEQMRVDEFLKEGKIENGRPDSDQLIQEDDYGMIADLDDDDELDGVALSNYDNPSSDHHRLLLNEADLSKQDDQQQNNGDDNKARANNNNKVNNNQRRIAAEKKERLLMANTVTVKQRSKQQRSAKTARLYSFGSLAEDDDDEDDDEDALSKSEDIAKMSDSDIDLDAIESDDEDDEESVSLSIELNPKLKSKNKTINNNNDNHGKTLNSSQFVKLSENLDKSDDNF